MDEPLLESESGGNCCGARRQRAKPECFQVRSARVAGAAVVAWPSAACGLAKRAPRVAIRFTVAFWIGVTRNLHCDPKLLEDIVPPYGGQLLPENFTLVERRGHQVLPSLLNAFRRQEVPPHSILQARGRLRLQ